MVTDRLLKAEEIADVLGISRSKAYRMMRLKEIPTVTIGKNVRVSIDDLEQFIQTHKQFEGDTDE